VNFLDIEKDLTGMKPWLDLSNKLPEDRLYDSSVKGIPGYFKVCIFYILF